MNKTSLAKTTLALAVTSFGAHAAHAEPNIVAIMIDDVVLWIFQPIIVV